MTAITDEMVEAAAKATDPDLFSENERIAHRTASPLNVDFAREKARALVRAALTAALSVEQEPVQTDWQRARDACVSAKALLSKLCNDDVAKVTSEELDYALSLFTRPSTEVDRLRAENERLREGLEGLVSVMEHCSVTSGVCGCGESMHNHSEFSGHSPTDYGSYVAEQAYQQARAALSQEGE